MESLSFCPEPTEGMMDGWLLYKGGGNRTAPYAMDDDDDGWMDGL